MGALLLLGLALSPFLVLLPILLSHERVAGASGGIVILNFAAIFIFPWCPPLGIALWLLALLAALTD
jgi:hypothetical protein